ncbi:fungal-specific transcription factor domain-containing protein [Stachybotrys elegans]|uniref:Fungal-specific transcription factor domain-containing protein n=1 Tax=Stachybotrys elegans TaxID=80388 RepID=A0A8K0WK19_9HYPO|nr:fungal-specific transcription factor domain-containing protein [Stachybotrys elegans]
MQRGARINRGLTCTNCRVRKTKCDGTQPGCKTCEVYRDKCRSEKPPPLSQILEMAKKLQDAEARAEQLQSALDKAIAANQLPSDATQTRANANWEDGETIVHVAPEQPMTGPETRNPQSELSQDASGKLCYYGPTSAVHEPFPLPENGESEVAPGTVSTGSPVGNRQLPAADALDPRAWEQFALGNATLHTDIPREVVAQLLQVYWTWIAPTFMWVYRPAFMRDMIMGGQYYSPFLLTVLCSHAARYGYQRTGEFLVLGARTLLATEITKPSSIATFQALLQLSARELACSSVSQAWLYSGMAFRMVSDLGLQHSGGTMRNDSRHTAEDIEIRKRLFWSCYVWDKAISLFLGRMPALTELPIDYSTDFEPADDAEEFEPWSPSQGDSVHLTKLAPGEYPPTQCRVLSCFSNYCKLAVIISDIILCLYSRTTQPDTIGAVKHLKLRLDDSRESSPAHLKCVPYSLPEELCALFEKTFGSLRMTYMMAYCVYTGATVMVQDVRRGDVDAVAKLQTFMGALQQAITTCPLVQRSIEILRNSLSFKAPAANHQPVYGSLSPEECIAFQHHLPAFPYHDVSGSNGGGDPYGGSVDTMSFLECFPESNWEATTEYWEL